MGDDVVTTGVDDLLAYLRDKDRVAMQDAATVLGVTLEALQAWVDFLVEEKILGIEYKFTKPFIYLNREDASHHKAKVIDQKLIPIEVLREEFIQRARLKQMPEQKIPELWASHVRDALLRKREYFIDQVARRNLSDANLLWDRYQTDLLSRC